jgi:hypothetical protein
VIASLLAALLLAFPFSARAQTTRVEADAVQVPRVSPLAAPLSAPAPTLSATPSLAALSAPSVAPAPAFAAAPLAAPALAPAPLPAAAAFSAAAPALSPAELRAAPLLPAGAPDERGSREAAAAPAAVETAPTGLARVRAAIDRAKNWVFPSVIPGPDNDAGGDYFHGTSLAVLEQVAASGGNFAARKTYVSNEPGFPFGYARTSARRTGTPGVILRFSRDAVRDSVVPGHWSPVYAPDRGRPQQLAQFFMASADLPLSALTPASKAAVIAHYAAERDRNPTPAAQATLESISRALGVEAPAAKPVVRPAAPAVPEAVRLDRDFAKLDLWSQVGPAAKAEIEGLRAKRLSKAEVKEYVRREVNAAFERIKAARGTENIGFHFNLHGGRREDYVEHGIRATKGDIALRYTMSGDANDKVYFFQTAAHDAYSALDASNGEMLFLPSRMGYALNVFAVDAPELKAAMADGRIGNVGSISMDFHKGMRSVPYSAYLAPPLEVFVRTAKKMGVKKLSRDEETLATARYLEAALTTKDSYIPGGAAASAESVARGDAARAQAAASAGPETSIPPQFALVDGAYLYHGTTLADLVKVLEADGRMAPDVSQFSYRARDSVGYASDRRRRLGREDNPEVLLQFRADDLNALTSAEQFRAALSVTDRGMPPVHAAYVAAVKPVPLSLMTPKSKDSILSWLRAKAARSPGEDKWAALAAAFEAAFNAP